MPFYRRGEKGGKLNLPRLKDCDIPAAQISEFPRPIGAGRIIQFAAWGKGSQFSTNQETDCHILNYSSK